MSINAGGVEYTFDFDTSGFVVGNDVVQKNLTAMEKKLETLEKKTVSYNKTVAKTTKGNKALSHGMGNAANQAADFAVQVEMGTSVMRAFGQQASQAFATLGPKGAIVGGIIAVGAAIGGTLIPMFNRASSATNKAIEELKEYADISNLAAAEAKALADIETEKNKEIKKSIAAIQSKIAALKSEDAAMLKAVKRFGAMANDERMLAMAQKEVNKEVTKYEAALVGQNKQLKASNELIEKYNTLAVGGTIVNDEQKAKVESLTQAMTQQLAVMKTQLSDGELAAKKLAIAFELGLDNAAQIPKQIGSAIDAIAKLEEAEKARNEKQQKDSQMEKRVEAIKKANATELELLKTKLETERELLNEYYALKLEDETLSNEEQAALRAEHEELLGRIAQAGKEARDKITDSEAANKKSAFSTMFNDISGIIDTAGRAMFDSNKKAAKATALVDAIQAIISAYRAGAAINPYVGAAYAAMAAVAQYKQIKKLDGVTYGGGGGASAGGGGASAGGGGASAGPPARQVNISGLDPNSLFSGRQVSDLLGETFGDGYTINFMGTT